MTVPEQRGHPQHAAVCTRQTFCLRSISLLLCYSGWWWWWMYNMSLAHRPPVLSQAGSIPRATHSCKLKLHLPHKRVSKAIKLPAQHKWMATSLTGGDDQRSNFPSSSSSSAPLSLSPSCIIM